jgi:exoribonuclease R
MTTDAEIVDTFFTKSVIRSKAAFTYAEAQNRIDDLYASAVPFKFFTYPLTH